jgi:hypothetical protein
VEFTPNPEMAPLHEELAFMKEDNPTGYLHEVPKELQMAHDLTVERGFPMSPRVVGSESVTQMRTKVNRPTLDICDYRNVVIDPSCKGKLRAAQFVVYSFETSLSELKKSGKYKNLDQINVTANTILGDPDHATQTPSNFNFADQARQKFVAYEYWGFRDIDGSGLVKPIVAAWVGDTLIRMEENPFPDKELPFVQVQYLPVRRENYGEPDGELLEDNQKVLGAVTRGMMDLMGKSANSQTGTAKNFLDAPNRKKFQEGRDYEFNNVDPSVAVHMHKYPEIPASAQFMVQMQNLEAESLTGVKTYSDGVSSNSLGDVAAGIRGALDAASKRELGILRRLSNGIVQIGRKIISMNAVFLSEEEVVRITNDEFVAIRRDDLGGEFDLSLTISTAEEDNAKAQELAFMLQTVGPKVDSKITFTIMADIARLRKMPDLAKRLEDYEPQPDPLQQRIQELEIAKLEAEIAKIQSETQENYANAELDMSKSGTEQAKTRHLNSIADKTDLDFVEQESGVTQERDLQKHGAQAKANAGLKILDHQLKKDLAVGKELAKYRKKS